MSEHTEPVQCFRDLAQQYHGIHCPTTSHRILSGELTSPGGRSHSEAGLRLSQHESLFLAPQLNLEPPRPSLPCHTVSLPGTFEDESTFIDTRSLHSMSESTADRVLQSPSPRFSVSSPISESGISGHQGLSRISSPAPVSHSTMSTPSRTASPRPRSSRARKNDTDENFVKRPLNSFMLYRKDNQQNIPTNNHQSISRIIGDMWRKETAETKNFYDILAKEERVRHQLQHPGYKFQPKKKENKSNKTPTKVQKAKKRQVCSTLQDARPKALPESDTMDHSFREQTASLIPLQPVSQSQYLNSEINVNEPDQYSNVCAYNYDAQSGMVLPPQYAHYTEQLQYMPTNFSAELYMDANVGAPDLTRRDPQDWHNEPSQDLLQEDLTLTHDSFGMYASGEMWLQDPLDALAYNATPQTFVEWDSIQEHGAALLPEHYQTGSHQSRETLYPSSTYPISISYDEQDFYPFQFKLGESNGFAPGNMGGTWEVEHESGR